MPRARRVLAAAFATALLAATASGGEPPAVRRLRLDLEALVHADRAPRPAELAAGAALIAAVAADDTGLAATARHHLPDELDVLEPGGRVAAANAVGAALVAGGLAAGERRAWVGGLTLLEGNLVLGVALDLAKSAFGRARPLEPHHGQFLRGGESFPSSHAAHAFLLASVLDATASRRWVRWTVYPLAGLVALSRLQNGAHHPTDVAAGAALGWWIGSRLARAHGLGRRGGGPRVTAAPLVGGALVVAAWTF